MRDDSYSFIKFYDAPYIDMNAHFGIVYALGVDNFIIFAISHGEEHPIAILRYSGRWFNWQTVNLLDI